jgi:hypothetical protein
VSLFQPQIIQNISPGGTLFRNQKSAGRQCPSQSRSTTEVTLDPVRCESANPSPRHGRPALTSFLLGKLRAAAAAKSRRRLFPDTEIRLRELGRDPDFPRSAMHCTQQGCVAKTVARRNATPSGGLMQNLHSLAKQVTSRIICNAANVVHVGTCGKASTHVSVGVCQSAFAHLFECRH